MRWEKLSAAGGSGVLRYVFRRERDFVSRELFLRFRGRQLVAGKAFVLINSVLKLLRSCETNVPSRLIPGRPTRSPWWMMTMFSHRTC